MARNRTAAVANQVAYDLGYQGVPVSGPLLSSYVQEGDEVEWKKRREVLADRVTSANLHHWTLMIVGSAVFIMALYVDYAIVHEYWTRLLSNEFGEVAPSMVNTVAAKSLQVLFATLAIHYVVSGKNAMGAGVRGTYSVVIFAVAFLMLLGIGIVWANASMPEGTKVFTGETSSAARALEQFSASMGVAGAATAQQAAGADTPAVISMLRENEILIRLVSLGVVFVVVASIGAISLHCVLRAYAAWTGASVYDHHNEAVLGRRLNAEYASFSAEDPSLRRSWFKPRAGDAGSGRVVRSRDDLISEFVKSYTAGVIDRQVDPTWSEKVVAPRSPEDLLRTMSAAVTFAQSGGSGPGDDRSIEDNVRQFPGRQ